MSKLEKLQAAAKRTESNISARFDEIVKRGTGRLLLAEIDPDPSQPRRSFASDNQAAFERSVAESGVLQPILVRRKEGRYQIVAGERRYRAAQKAGLEDIPAVVRDEMPPEVVLEYQLLENILRQDLNPIDRADGMLELMVLRSGKTREIIEQDIKKRYRDTGIPSEVAKTVDEVLALFGKTLSTFWRFDLSALKMPADLLEVVRRGELDVGHALLLKPILSSQERSEWIKRVKQERLSREELRKLLTSKKPKQKIDQHVRLMQKQFKRLERQLPSLEQEKARWLMAELEKLMLAVTK
jgi:ParB family transcriptional regulator, chromosome partitioning protein